MAKLDQPLTQCPSDRSGSQDADIHAFILTRVRTLPRPATRPGIG
jgi:hypothetical protein